MKSKKGKTTSGGNQSGISSPFDTFARTLESQQRSEAYNFACETRKFEIELYWKRATYFWGFLIVTFAGYGVALREFGFGHIYTFVIALIGITFSLAWYFANRGSKFWQKNWEHHIAMLEDEFAGPIYKNPIETKPFRFFKLMGAYPISISRLNQAISLYISVIWFMLAMLSISTLLDIPEPITYFNTIAFGVITVVFIIGLLRCRSGRR